jgi:hypothetical protein
MTPGSSIPASSNPGSSDLIPAIDLGKFKSVACVQGNRK